MILAATEWELSQPFYYEVRVNGEVVVPKFLICGGKDDGKFKFNVMSAKGGHLVGVFAEKYPREVLALHDFSENLTWPGALKNESETHNPPTRKRLLDELQRENLDDKLTIGNPRCR